MPRASHPCDFCPSSPGVQISNTTRGHRTLLQPTGVHTILETVSAGSLCPQLL